MTELVLFDRRERDVAVLLYAGSDPKAIAGILEIAQSTVYLRINAMCDRAGVLDRSELLIWILQHPGCLTSRIACPPGLHAQPCACGAPYCVAALAAQLRQA